MSKATTGVSSPNGRVSFNNPAIGVSFTLPARLTIREQLAFATRRNAYISSLGVEVGDDGEPVERDDADVYTPYWSAGLKLIQDWQCEFLPDPAALDPDEETDPRIARVVIWTANTIWGHTTNIGGETVPKN